MEHYVAPMLVQEPEAPYEVLAKQKEDEALWRGLRVTGISASIVPEILGLFPGEWISKGYKRTRAGVIRELAATDPTRESQKKLKKSPTLECGIRCEPMVIGWASDLTSKLYLPWGELLRSREHPWMLATPDGAHESSELIEVKCTRYPWWRDGLPEYVRAQVMAQLAVTGYPRAVVAQWSWGNRPEIYEVTRNERLIGAIVKTCEVAWREVEAARKEIGR